ncbi:MAG TPA: T9SS type A sorting domain-containing protein, partial [Cytophagaceae bacterium]|nr:T9SS type A sorting domain-containing protein [Cytophagaceae bacterium]
GSAGSLLSGLSIPQSTTSSSCALPVELLNFNAKAIGKYNVQLDWSTASEMNNDFFSLESSKDGIHFFPVAKVYGKENSRQLISYTYTDEVQAYDILYYRLSQTDLDGNTVHLGIKTVYPASNLSSTLGVYPNPCNGRLYLQMANNQKETLQSIALVSTCGGFYKVSAKEEGLLLYIDTAPFAAGVYSLIVTFNDHIQVIKIIKSDY